jgi:uncharacterized protein YjiK
MPKPEKIRLNKKLNEISGLTYDHKENVILAIADDKRQVYKLTDSIKEKEEVPEYFNEDFGPSEDYEDITKAGDDIFVLMSNGTIGEIKKIDSTIKTTFYPFWSKDKNDFETLYYDSASNGLIMLCKMCAIEKGKNVKTAYRFDLASRKFDTQPFYTISETEVKDMLKDGKVEFKPSAAAIHPLLKKLYVLTSAGQLLVVTNMKGKVEEVYRLNPTLYPQAEGITFAPNGDMYVSNEAKLGIPTLLKLVYKPSEK